MSDSSFSPDEDDNTWVWPPPCPVTPSPWGASCPVVPSPSPPVSLPLPPGFVWVAGLFRDGTGQPLDGLLLIDIPFSFVNPLAGAFPVGRSYLFVVAGQVFQDQCQVTRGWLPVTPAKLALKFSFKPADGTATEKYLGATPIPGGASVIDLPSLLFPTPLL
jgi:hypothetical protein